MEQYDIDRVAEELSVQIPTVSNAILKSEVKKYLCEYHLSPDATKRGILRKYNQTSGLIRSPENKDSSEEEFALEEIVDEPYDLTHLDAPEFVVNEEYDDDAANVYYDTQDDLVSQVEVMIRTADPNNKEMMDGLRKLLEMVKANEKEIMPTQNYSELNNSTQGSSSVLPPNRSRYEISKSKYQPVEGPGITFDCIAGLNSLKKEIQETVILPLIRPDLYEYLDLESNTGILMYGPPGTGKTMFAQAVATEVDAKFFTVKCSDLESPHPGVTERNIAELFHSARSFDRSVIFFDEFEALGMSRDIGFNQDIMSGKVTELLAQMNGFEKGDSTVVLIAATNRPWDIDAALMRPGRFGTHI